MGATAGAYIGDTTPTEESTTPSRGASTGAHVSETNKQLSCSSRTVEEILGVYPMNDDDFWGETNPGNMSTDTVYSKEMMARSHITEQHTHRYQIPVPLELLNATLNEPQTYDLPQNYQLDSPKNPMI